MKEEPRSIKISKNSFCGGSELDIVFIFESKLDIVLWEIVHMYLHLL
jgi:hypothetical protein